MAEELRDADGARRHHPAVPPGAAGRVGRAEISGADTTRYRAKQFVQSLPGRKVSLGGTIPDDIHDTILHTARGITQPVWGREPLPQHIQELYEQGHHTPDAVHAAYGAMPHPHAQGLSVADYQRYSSAYQAWQQHR